MYVRAYLLEQKLKKELSAVQAEIRTRFMDLTGGEKGTAERIIKMGPQHVEKQVTSRKPVLENPSND
jgi:hypothetical protein